MPPPTPGLQALRAAHRAMGHAAWLLLWPAVCIADSTLSFLPGRLHRLEGLGWLPMPLLLLPAIPILRAAWILRWSTLAGEHRRHHLALRAAGLLGALATASLCWCVVPLHTPLRLAGLAAAGVWALVIPLAYAVLSRSLARVLGDPRAKRRLGWSATAMTTAAILTGAAINASGENPASLFFLAALAGPLGLIGANRGLGHALRVTEEERALHDALDTLPDTGLTLVEDRMPLQVRLHLNAALPTGLRVAALDQRPSPTGNPVLDAVLPLHIPACMDLSALVQAPAPLLEVLHAHPRSTLSPQGLTLQATLPELLSIAARDGVSLQQALESRVLRAHQLRAALVKASP